MIFWKGKETPVRTDIRLPEIPARKVVAMLNTLFRMEYIN